MDAKEKFYNTHIIRLLSLTYKELMNTKKQKVNTPVEKWVEHIVAEASLPPKFTRPPLQSRLHAGSAPPATLHFPAFLGGGVVSCQVLSRREGRVWRAPVLCLASRPSGVIYEKVEPISNT